VHAKDHIYVHIKDHTAQDLLLRLLAPLEERENETLESILCHPFFSAHNGSSLGAETRKIEAVAHRRGLQNKMAEVSENFLLEERTVKVNCWDFAVLERIHFSPTEMVKRLMPDQQWRHTILPFPCGLLILPYAIGNSRNDTSYVGMAFGLEYIKFSKACYFATVLKRKVESLGKNTKPKWSCTEVLQDLGLSSSDFCDVQSSLSMLAAKHVELFRSDPVAIALMVVQQSILNLFAFFDDSSAHLHLVDEFRCASVKSDIYPIEASGQRKHGLLQNGLLFMHLCSLHARCVSKDLSGVAKLFGTVEDDSLSVPDSWTQAAEGITYELDERYFFDEIGILQDALTDMYSTRHRIAADDLNFVQEFLYDADPRRSFATMRRVSASGMCLWTTEDGFSEIEGLSRTHTFRDVLDRLKGEEEGTIC